MKIKISKIKVGKFSIRDKIDEEHINIIRESFKLDGQWNPVIVRPDGEGNYELIAGHYRIQAAKELGWDEIEATVKDLENLDADVLSLKTNIIRAEMSPTEKGKVINKIITEYGISQKGLADKLGISQAQVSKLLTLALSLHKSVADALSNGDINYGVASVIGSLELEKQHAFLKLIKERKITQPSEASNLKAKFLNNTIYTIGYQGRNSDNFIDILKNNKIEIVLDARFSSKSEKKPEFNKEILEKELKRNNIKYIHNPDLGIPYIIQTPYKEGKLSFECLKQWYHWHIENETELDEIINVLKDSGKPAIMCMERYAKKMRDQKYACHRDILADLILNYNISDELLKFQDRVDL